VGDERTVLPPQRHRVLVAGPGAAQQDCRRHRLGIWVVAAESETVSRRPGHLPDNQAAPSLNGRKIAKRRQVGCDFLTTCSESDSGGTGPASQPNRTPGSRIEVEIPVDVIGDRHGRPTRDARGSLVASLPMNCVGGGKQSGDGNSGAETMAAECDVGCGGRDAHQFAAPPLKRDHNGCPVGERNR